MEPGPRLTRPTTAVVRAFLAAQRGLPYTYEAVGATREGNVPPGFAHDRNRQLLGRGERVFAAARDAIRAWAMFPAPLAWIEPHGVPIAAGELAGVVIRALGLWWLNAARI